MAIATDETSVTSYVPGRSPIGTLCLIFTLACGLIFSGCGGGDSSSEGGDGGSGSSDEIVTQVEEMLEEIDGLIAESKQANAEKYKASDMEAALKLVTKARDYLADDNAKRARTTARSAKRKLESVIEGAQKVSAQMKSVEEKLTEYDAKLKEITELGADKFAASEMEGALRSYDKAQGYISAGKASSAKKYLGYAISDLDRAKEEFQKSVTSRKSADDEKTLMAEKRQEALDAGAEEKALRDLEYAKDVERRGDQAYGRNDFDSAARCYRDAKNGYIGAIEVANRPSNPIAGSNGNGGGVRQPDHTGGGQVDDAPGIDDINIPDIGSGGDLDLTSGLAGLFHGSAEYNATKGSLRLNWADGTELEQDMKQLLGDPANTIFEGDEGVGQGQDGSYVMAGNTKGYWIVNSSFEDGVRIRAKVLFQLLIDKPSFEILLMSDGGQDFYAASYGAHAKVYKNGLPVGQMSSPLQAYKKNPKDWVQKREPYEFEFIYYKRGEDKGILEAKINGETTVKLKTDRFRKGFPGIRWNDTKFIIQELEVSGLVDEEWAKERLKSAADGTLDEGSDTDIDF